MSGRYQARFFDSQSSESQIKLRIYESYLKPWTSMRGSRGGTIWVVDGFAGRGRYKTGEPGSPEIAMRRAQELAKAGSRYKLQCIFGDQKKSNTSMLYELRGLYPAASALIIEDDFWARVDDVIRLVGSSPVLLFVDPFGLLGIDFAALAKLVAKLPRLDLIVNFRSPAAHRLAPGYADRISTAVGSTCWEPETITDIFRGKLQAAGKFLRPATLSVRVSSNGAVRSELILAARNPVAYELWNDQVVLEAERLASATNNNTLSDRDATIDEVTNRLVEWLRSKRQWQRPEARSWHVVNYCGDAHSGTVNRAHGELEKSGAFRRLHRSPNIDKDWFSHA